jgi:hypothetical protein
MVEWPLLLLAASVSSPMILAIRLNVFATSALVIGFVPIAPLIPHSWGPGYVLASAGRIVSFRPGDHLASQPDGPKSYRTSKMAILSLSRPTASCQKQTPNDLFSTGSDDNKESLLAVIGSRRESPGD